MPNTLLRCIVVSAVVLLGGSRSLAIAGVANVFTLTSFSGSTGTGPNGAKPYAGVLVGADGTLYGTTHQGGTNGFPSGYGTIFKITPGGAYTTLFSFNNSNGSQPYGALSLGENGNLYGTTSLGGAASLGTIFQITANGEFTSLFSFSGANGAKPAARLKLGTDGAFYGTTQQGGSSNLGTLFRITTNGVFSLLHSFAGTNGSRPYAEVCLGPEGHLYGTTLTGGASNLGTVFRYSTNGVFESIFSFAGTNGATPYGGLTLSPSGEFYGTTAEGGTYAAGTIFQITTNGFHTVLRALNGVSDGANPRATLLRGADGTYYGTTIMGGEALSVPRGTAFQFSTNGAFVALASFGFDFNGASPHGGLAQGGDGSLYGTTFDQGSGLKGTVFRLDPAAAKLQSRLVSGFLEITWAAWLGRTYQLQFKASALQNEWNAYYAPIPATNPVMVIQEPVLGSSQLYRLRQILP